MVFNIEEGISKPVRIIGKVVELRGKFQVVLYVFIRFPIDTRVNTCYNITMIRKGDTKDANDAERDD